jgi:hypothetical protein
MVPFLLSKSKLAFINILFSALLLIFGLATQKTHAQSWEQKGAELSTGSATFCSVATEYDGTKTIPYIAYVEDLKVRVKRLVNNVWEDLGLVSQGNASYPYLAVGPNRAIWVAYKNDSTSVGGKFAIKQFNGTSWVVKGELSLSPGNISTNSLENISANRCHITICEGGTPYIVYSDYSNPASTLYGNAYVKKYDSFTNTWTFVGQGSVKSTGSRSLSASLAFDTNHNLYIAYADGLDAGNPNVLKYQSLTDSWLNISTTGTSTSVRNCGIAINKNNSIFLNYFDLIKQKASLLKFDNTSLWETLGDVNGFSIGTTTANTVRTDAAGNTFVYYIDKASSGSGVDFQRSVVKKWAVNSANTDPLTEINSTPIPTPNGFGEGTISGSLTIGINNLLYTGLVIPSSISAGLFTPRLKVSGLESAFNGYFISKQSGDFNASSTWVIYPTNANINSLIPSSGDGVVIESGHTVTLRANQSVKNITIENGAQLLSDGTLRTLIMGTTLAADSLSFIKNDGEFGSTSTGTDKIDLIIDNISNIDSTTFTLSGLGISKLNSFKINKNTSVTLPQIKKVTANINQNLNISAASVSFSAIPSLPAINEDYTLNVGVGNTVLMTSTTAQFNAAVAPQAASGSGIYTYNIFGTIDCSASTQNFGIVPIPNNPSSSVTLNIKQGGKFMSGSNLQLKNTGTTVGLYDNQGKVFLNVDGEADLTKITANVNSNITAYWNLSSTGVVRRTVTGATTIPSAFTFPVGTSTGYSPVSIRNAGTTGVFSVRVTDDFSSTPLQDATKSVKQKWTVNAENAASVISELRLGWLGIDEGSSFASSRGASQINYFDDSTWKSINNSTTSVPTTTSAMYNTNSGLPNTYNATATTTGTIPLSASFAIIAPSTLPLNLIYFNAILNGFIGSKYVSLSWITTNEINTKSFLIERQTEQNIFEAVGEIISKNSANEQYYTYTDHHPSLGDSYYRLKMVDQDGKFTISDIKAIKNESNFGIVLSPNPVKEKLTITYPQAQNAATIQIWSLTGKQIRVIPVQINSQQTIINVSELQPGTYMILFKDIKEQVAIKFIKI